MMIRYCSVTLLAMLAIACSPREEAAVPADPAQLARDIAMTSIITDGHIDVPNRLKTEWVDVSISTEDGDFDFPRALACCLNVPFMYFYLPA